MIAKNNIRKSEKKKVIRFWAVLIIGIILGTYIVYSEMTSAPPHDFRGVIVYFIFFITITLLLLADFLMKDEGKHYNKFEGKEPIDYIGQHFAPADE